MTDRRPLLRAIFDAAVAAAHPDVILGSHLHPVPRGNVICLAAGKGAASTRWNSSRRASSASPPPATATACRPGGSR
jgi:glycerate-2-kinase